MAEVKTKPTKASVEAFLNRVEDEARRKDCFALLKVMKQATKAKPVMWGPSGIGFGNYHYKYASGHEGDCAMVGFAPRKRDLTLYFMTGFAPYGKQLAKLGKFKTGKCCLYVKRLADVDCAVLTEIIADSFARMTKMGSAAAVK